MTKASKGNCMRNPTRSPRALQIQSTDTIKMVILLGIAFKEKSLRILGYGRELTRYPLKAVKVFFKQAHPIMLYPWKVAIFPIYSKLIIPRLDNNPELKCIFDPIIYQGQRRNVFQWIKQVYCARFVVDVLLLLALDSGKGRRHKYIYKYIYCLL